jgi:hypothetical protein
MAESEQGDQKGAISRKLAAWSKRAALAQVQKQADVEQAALAIVDAYRALLESDSAEPEELVQANVLRKKIESAEQHRTMAAEHGLNDEAIDVTYEIQQLESELVALVKRRK